MSSFATIRGLIATKLGTISELAVVDNFHHTDLTGFPAVTFEPSGNESDFITNSENERIYAFRLLVHQEIESTGRENAITILMGAVDAIITAFDSDFNLSSPSNINYIEATPSAWGEYTAGQGAFKFAEIILRCHIEVQVL